MYRGVLGHRSDVFSCSEIAVDPLVVPSRLYFYPPTPRRRPFGLRHVCFCVAYLPLGPIIQQSQGQSRSDAVRRSRDKHFRGRMHCERAPLGPQYASQVRCRLFRLQLLKQSVLIVFLSDTIGSAGGLDSCSVSDDYCIPCFK